MSLFAENKKVRHDYEILETFTAGISLVGPEVKAIRANNISLKESYIKVKDNQAFLRQAHTSRPDYIDLFTNFDETRDRPLLLTKKELSELQKAVQQDGLTVMALKVFQPEDSRNIKLLIGICKGKNNADKRETLKQKAVDMDTKRALKDY